MEGYILKANKKKQSSEKSVRLLILIWFLRYKYHLQFLAFKIDFLIVNKRNTLDKYFSRIMQFLKIITKSRRQWVLSMHVLKT